MLSLDCWTVMRLEGVPEAELELPVRTVGATLGFTLTKCTGSVTCVRVIQGWMVRQVKCLRTENQSLTFVTRNDLERLIQGSAVALKSRTNDLIASTSRRKLPCIQCRKRG